MKKRFIYALPILCLSVVLFSSYIEQKTKADKPNIILIYADDLGIGLLGHEGQKIIKTPHIDQLARDGIRFQNAYSNMLCAPARASLLTGMHDCHENGFQITSGGSYKFADADPSAFEKIGKAVEAVLSPTPDEQVFLGEVAKKAGYKTAEIGKLEWGFSSTDRQMNRHGWDHYLGYLDHERAHGFYPPFLFEDGKLKQIEGNTLVNSGKSGEPETPANFEERWNRKGKARYSQTIFMERVLDYIESNKDEPFFLYFPTQLPHGPVSIPAVHPDFQNDNRLTQIEKEYASMVKLLDDNVGQIVEKVKSLGIEDNTIIIFTSDNGHEIYYSQAGRVLKPYTNMETGERFDNYKRKFYSELGGDVFNGNGGRAGLKRSNLEGGIRVPLILKWPGKIKKGSTSKRLVANYDILPTLAKITGFETPFRTDGISFYNELLGKGGDEAHPFVVYASFIGPTLVTKDGWKIRTYLKENAFELYHLPNDAREENDLAEKYPGKLKDLKSKLLKACEGNLSNGLYDIRNQIDIPGLPGPQTQPSNTTIKAKQVPSNFSYETALAPEDGVTRRDPSDVIKVGEFYYLWYTKVLENQAGYPSGYPGAIAYAVSRDGNNWKERGVCLETGKGQSWDSHGVFTPNILVANGKYYLFYTAVPEPFDVPQNKGITPTAIGLAVADHPEGPWKKFKGNPILKPEKNDPDYFDSFRVDDASLIVRDGKYWLYYKGRGQNKTPQETKMGLAIAPNPTGPYIKQKQFGPLHAGHEVLVWPLNGGVASMATAAGPKAIYFAADGVHFELQGRVENSPSAPGIYRSDNFENNTSMQPPYWGISHKAYQGKNPQLSDGLFLQRFQYIPE